MKKLKLFVILLITVINLMFMSNCWVAGMFTFYEPTELFESGYVSHFYRAPAEGYSYTPFFVIKSDKNIFDINDITVDLYIALYEKEEVEIYGREEHNKADFVCTAFEYITNEDGKNELSKLNEVIVRSLSKEEILNDDLFVTLYNTTIVNYKYSEKITLPKELFVQNEGYFYIECNLYNTEIVSNYKHSYIIFEYIKLDEDTIQLRFEYENYEKNDILEFKYLN